MWLDYVGSAGDHVQAPATASFKLCLCTAQRIGHARTSRPHRLGGPNGRVTRGLVFHFSVKLGSD
jgi:hypothetical protein